MISKTKWRQERVRSHRLFFGDAFSTPPVLAVGIDLQLKNKIFSKCMTGNEAKYVGVFKNIDLKKNYMI